jgi:hypothetical protein
MDLASVSYYRDMFKPKFVGFAVAAQYLQFFWNFLPLAQCVACVAIAIDGRPAQGQSGMLHTWRQVAIERRCRGACMGKAKMIAILAAIATFNVKQNSPNRRAAKRTAHRAHVKTMQALISGVPCFCCQKPAQHRHHIIPLSMGGNNSSSNQVMLCKACHRLLHNLANQVIAQQAVA